jgi:hypothetical protein
MLRRQSDEEKEAKRLEQERKREETAKRKEAEQQERDRQAFLASPAGRARTAFERGDRVFQFSLDVLNTQPLIVPMVGSSTNSTSNDPTEILNSVCNEGWELVNGSFVFHELGSQSRDKFMSSGQNVAVKGSIIGYYLFKRAGTNLQGGTELAAADYPSG